MTTGGQEDRESSDLGMRMHPEVVSCHPVIPSSRHPVIPSSRGALRRAAPPYIRT